MDSSYDHLPEERMRFPTSSLSVAQQGRVRTVHELEHQIATGALVGRRLSIPK